MDRQRASAGVVLRYRAEEGSVANVRRVYGLPGLAGGCRTTYIFYSGTSSLFFLTPFWRFVFFCRDFFFFPELLELLFSLFFFSSFFCMLSSLLSRVRSRFFFPSIFLFTPPRDWFLFVVGNAVTERESDWNYFW